MSRKRKFSAPNTTPSPSPDVSPPMEVAASQTAASQAAAAPNEAENSRFWTWAMAILVFGIALRQFRLAEFPFHPDEAIHAWFPLSFLTYTFDPVYHGPLLYHLQAFVYGVIGPNDFTARLVPSLLGIGLLAVIIGPARRWLGERGALWSLALLTLSPIIATYQRRLLHDSLVLLLTLGAVLCFQAAREHASDTPTGRRARIGLAALLALFLATKANVFFIMAMLVAFWLLSRLRPWLHARLTGDARRNLAAYLLPLLLFLFEMLALFAVGRLQRATAVSWWAWSVPLCLALLLFGAVALIVLAKRRRDARSMLALWSWLPPVALLGIVVASILALRDPVEWKEAIEPCYVLACGGAMVMLWLWLLLAPHAQHPSRNSDQSTFDAGSTYEAGSTSVEFPAPRRRDVLTPALAGWAALLIFSYLFGRGFLWYQSPLRLATQPVSWSQGQTAALREIGTTAVQPLAHLARGEFGSVWQATKLVVTKEKEPWDTPEIAKADVLDYTFVTSAIPRMLQYWGRQQKAPRLPGRHDYYIVLMLLYELPIVLAGLAGIVYASRHRTAFSDLLLWWTLTSFTLYAIANEKVPWLLTHIMLPWALLAGYWLAQLRVSRSLRPAFIAASALGAIYLLWGTLATNFGRPVDKHEPMFFAQASEKFRDALYKAVLKTSEQDEHGKSVWMQQDRQWPTVWYLRSGSPLIGRSAMTFSPTPPSPLSDLRYIVSDEGQWQAEGAFQNWKGHKADFYIWPRASWPALRPHVWLRFWWTREATVENGVLAPPGEWPAPAVAVIATPPCAEDNSCP